MSEDIVRRKYDDYDYARAQKTPRAAQELADAILHDLGDDLMVAIDPRERTFWIQSYIREQKEAFKSRERDRALCTCNQRCLVTKGKIPKDIRDADALSDGLREFRADHPGDPVVIDEAIEAYRGLRETARHRLTIAEAILKMGHREEHDEYDEYPLPAGVESPEEVLDGVEGRLEVIDP